MATMTKTDQIRRKAQAAVAAAKVKGFKLTAMAQASRVRALSAK